jgi:hypothetical protein
MWKLAVIVKCKNYPWSSTDGLQKLWKISIKIASLQAKNLNSDFLNMKKQCKLLSGIILHLLILMSRTVLSPAPQWTEMLLIWSCSCNTTH